MRLLGIVLALCQTAIDAKLGDIGFANTVTARDGLTGLGLGDTFSQPLDALTLVALATNGTGEDENSTSGPGDSGDDDAGAARDCADLVTFKLSITVMGKLGPPNGAELGDAEKDLAGKWVFSALLRSMLHNRGDGETNEVSSFKLSQTARPKIVVKTVKPFETNDGQRSPLEQTIIEVSFPETDVCSAMGFGKFVCGDYDSGDEELLNGILRALDVAKAYPRQAMDAVSKAGLGPKSMVIVRVATLDRGTIMNSCNWGARMASGSIQGALLLPACPAHSVRCEARENFCKEDEPSWKCKCTLGYQGELTIPNLETLQGPFNIVGECQPIAGYCKFDDFPLRLDSGEAAKGVLGETATPECPPGFEAAGSSECTESQSREGQWSPTPRCNYIPPTAPPEPFCSSPQLDPTLSFRGCGICFGVESGKTGPPCDCEVHCAEGHEKVGSVATGQKSCVATEFQCPRAISADGECLDEQTNKPTMQFCCDEAWGANIPPTSLTSKSCRDITEDKECLTSVQSAMGVDAGKAGQPCCWSRGGFGSDSSLVCVAKESEAIQGTTPSACAFPRRVLTAAWQDLPSCIPPCVDNFDRAFLDVSGCERCYGAEATAAQPCSCEVTCAGDTVRIGGGPEGSRTCEAVANGGHEFGQSPACWLKPLPLSCPSVAGAGRRTENCDCEAGGSCDCKVHCEYGHVRTDGGEEGDKTCHVKPLELQVKACEDITEEEECLKSHGQGHSGAGAAVPCCWNKDGFGNGKKCLQAGSSEISQHSIPNSCAQVSFTEWDPLPTCTPLCTMDMLRGRPHLIIDPSCETCIAGQDCNCTVQCQDGFPRHGGGAEGARSCTPDDLSLGTPPVCRAAKAGEPGKYPACPLPQVANASVDCQCKGGPDGCECPVYCKYTHGNIKADAPEGPKKCVIEETPPPEGVCSELPSEAECLSHTQGGEPCCFRETGLYADASLRAVSGSVCAAKGDPKMFFEPTSCAKSLFPKWEEMPECHPRCVPNLVRSHNDIVQEDCDKCIAGQLCPCKVKCDHARGFERIGGGSEGSRSCSAVSAEALTFEEPPLCRPVEATPRCKAVPADVSLRLSECAGCTAGQTCNCKVTCASGYAPFTDVNEGAKACSIDPNYALAETTCKTATSQEACMASAEGGVPCCWRGLGFKDGAKCAKKGSDAIGLKTPPDGACAPTKAAKMDPSPVCKMLCVNKFISEAYVEVENCDRCFVNEPCDCSVKCQVNTIQRAGDKGSKSCGHVPDDPTSFGAKLVCEPREPPKVPSCDALVDTTYAYAIQGCRNCKAGDANCACEVSCAQGHKRTSGGDEGAKKCLSEIYECPVRVRWDETAERCSNVDSGKFVDTFCCPEARSETIELDDSAACTSLADEKSCLKAKDAASKEVCCWRGTGFAAQVKCAAKGSDAITEEFRPWACSNRPKILKAHFEERPVCTAMCQNPFKATWAQRLDGQTALDVKGCETCVPGESDCVCTVNCPTGAVYAGGGREDGAGTRICDAQTGEYPMAPTCMPEPPPTSCPTPTGYGLVVKGCASCTVGQACQCSVTCDRGMAPSQGTVGAKVCQGQAAPLTEAKCSQLADRTSCLNSWEGGKPCCFRTAGFYNGGPVCAAKGTEDVQATPEECAALEVGVFPDLPKCMPVCATNFPLLARSYSASKDCNKCIADQPCACQMDCQDGYEFWGGKPPGPRTCAFNKPFLPPPPVCQRIQPLECTSPAEDLLQNVNLEGCSRCVAGSDRCRCSVKCLPGHILLPGSTAQPGAKRCLVVDAPGGETKCEDLKEESQCASSIYASLAEGRTACCWQPTSDGGGMCLPRGSPFMFKRSGISPSCANLQLGEFEEFPKCVAACSHNFDQFSFLAFDKKACGRCTPVQYPGQQDCACGVACAANTERVGGGPESPKLTCSADSLSLGAPPACMATPPPRECPRPDSAGLKVQGCRKCHAGEADCHCSLSCLAGYKMARGSPGDYVCKEEDAMDLLTPATCSGLSSAQKCMGAKQALDGGFQLCCWRQSGFANGQQCAAKGSAEITADTIPDACAPASAGRFRPLNSAGQEDLPVCTPTCTNIFTQMSTLVVTGTCDDCEPGKDCDCEVNCKAPLKPLAGNEGIRRCLMKNGLAEFEPAPDCVQPCATPDHMKGTLDISGCKNNCVPGDEDCQCEVRCAAGNVRIGGGHEGSQRCDATSRGPMYQKLPQCRPKCAAPDSQFDSLNVRQCASCIAGTNCNCQLTCYTQASSSGAREGQKKCTFIEGKENSPAAAMWEAVDGQGPPGVPQCLPPMQIQVQDARTQQPLSGVLIRVYVPYSADSSRLREIQTLNTAHSTMKDLSVEFSSEARDLTVKIEKQGYTELVRKLDRGKNCKDAFKCRFQFSISELLEGGVLYPEGCFLVGKPAEMEWDMRAVLEWDEKPLDLDIWARNYECYRQVERDYHCDGKKAHTLDPTDTSLLSRRRTLCKRTLFTQDNVRNHEWKVCGASVCNELKNAQTQYTRRRHSRPDCPYQAHNQFPKWVFWAVRQMTSMHKRWRRKQILEQFQIASTWIGAPREKVWNRDNYMILDIDKRTGFGPETMSFKNVPPGTYQVVVNQFSSTGTKPALETIAKANPRVNLYIGGNSVSFECTIPVECQQPSRVWNVVNIQVRDMGPLEGSTTGEHKFSIRLADRAADMIPLKWVDLPTGGHKGRDRYSMDYFYPSKVTAVEYTDAQLRGVCHGECVPADETFNDCLIRKPTSGRRLWYNATIDW